jgi:hypothetical protein
MGHPPLGPPLATVGRLILWESQNSLLGIDGEPGVQELIGEVFDPVADILSGRIRKQNTFCLYCNIDYRLAVPF